MNDSIEQDNQAPVADTPSRDSTPGSESDISPDTLMSDFRGKPLGSMLMFTILFHIVFIGVFSLGYFSNLVLGESTAEMDTDQRMTEAVRAATSEIDDIADRYGIEPQDLIQRFSDGSRPSVPAAESDTQAVMEQDTTVETVEAAESQEPEGELSAIEAQLQVKEQGPAVPDLSVEEEEDLFAPQP